MNAVCPLQVKEAGEREAELVRQLGEVREQMVRDAQAAAAREDRLRRDVRELEARCQVGGSCLFVGDADLFLESDGFCCKRSSS